ncbi:hypothetical protein Airi02_061100 [Actinoallomurus iriomotensis]|uniref:RNA polymerase sigma factor 70 region 4 type 2 domain-containing protein n=1 Tax=Actinoallomurus iriomotensis TaxID=478107 RepID=A0A9W6S405_9ACTN|nr:hypothetical protein Airi02_061100 [Actinoallomurus iriomotensis]
MSPAAAEEEGFDAFYRLEFARAVELAWLLTHARAVDAQDRLVSLPRDDADPVDGYLRDAIGVLPYRQRVVIVARYWGDWTETEIAGALGCRPEAGV